MANRYGNEDDPKPWRGDARSWHERYERPGAGAVGFGRESWGDEPRHFGRSQSEEPRREPRDGWELHQGLHRSEWGRPEEFRELGRRFLGPELESVDQFVEVGV